MGDTFSERKLSIRDVSIHTYGDSAWAEFYWDFAAKFRKDGAPLATKGRETQIYHKEQRPVAFGARTLFGDAGDGGR